MVGEHIAQQFGKGIVRVLIVGGMGNGMVGLVGFMARSQRVGGMAQLEALPIEVEGGGEVVAATQFGHVAEAAYSCKVGLSPLRINDEAESPS